MLPLYRTQFSTFSRGTRLNSVRLSVTHPFSEAQFRALKYCPEFSERFGSIEDGRAFGQVFVPWNNHEHHSGRGFLTPATVLFGQAVAVRAQRARVLAAASAVHPERFVNGRPLPADLSTSVSQCH
jgi:putative transposase